LYSILAIIAKLKRIYKNSRLTTKTKLKLHRVSKTSHLYNLL